MKIYLYRNGEQSGPYSRREIRRLFARGKLLPTDLGWHEGQRDWIPLKDLLDVQDAAVSPSESESPSATPRWLSAGIIVVSLLVALYIGFLIRTQIKALGTGEPLVTNVKLIDANGAPIIQTKPMVNTFLSVTNGNSNQVNEMVITSNIKVASQPVEGSQSNDALDTINATLKSDPKNLYAYLNRAAIYGQNKLWSQAESDYMTVLQLDNNNFVAKFNLAEIKFQQKEYDDARADFIALKDSPENGDLANYKVFLCDLFNGNEVMAAKELSAFNQVGANASYYFGNAAWDLYHKKPEEAREWLASAKRIYTPNKCSLYGASLQDLGYLPLAPANQ